MKQTKILYVASECKGFAVTGGLSEVAGSLPQALLNTSKSYKVKVVMPLYKSIIELYGKKLKFIGSQDVQLAWRKVYCGVYTLKKDKIDYYFVDNKAYFDRDKLYGYYDDGERFAFFSKSIFTVMDIIDYYPNIIHTNDWHTALVNIYLDVLYKKEGKYMDIKSAFTIHNIEYQGVYDLPFLEDVVGIDKKYQDILEYRGLINLIKGAIVCSDIVTTVSPRYSKEIATSQYACGLEHIIRLNNQKISGIINGIDVDFYNPETDPSQVKNYSVDTIEDKLTNKLALQKMLNLEINENVCIISLITRLAGHKGIDLVIDRFDEIMKENVQVVLLGCGERFYEEKFLEFSRRYPGRVSALIVFDMNLSKKIYGATDLFLMPSKMEPCGLSQMIASRYGTVPIVRATGGLYDTIKDYSNNGNGFVFKEYNSFDMIEKIKEAVSVYNNKEEYLALQKRVMQMDFSWNASAKMYIEMYRNLMK